MKEVLTEFWGDAVEIDDDAALTWMHQSHYYMGLYRLYLLSWLGYLNSGILAFEELRKRAKDWLELLKSGQYRPHLGQP